MRLLHPMMPFVSEELYQKLPNFKGKAKSLTIAEFPTIVDNEQTKDREAHFKKIEELFEIVNSYASAIRSLASSVNLPPNIRAEAFILTK